MSCFAAAHQISADNFLINLWKYYIKTYGDTTKRENWYAYLEYFYRVLLFTTQSCHPTISTLQYVEKFKRGQNKMREKKTKSEN